MYYHFNRRNWRMPVMGYRIVNNDKVVGNKTRPNINRNILIYPKIVYIR